MEDNDEGRCMHGCYPVDIDTIREIARTDGAEKAQQWLDENQPRGEPYVGADDDEPHQRKMKITAGSQGIPVDSYLATLSILENHHDYEVNKVQEWLQANPGSQLHQEMQQRRQQAEQQINRVLSSLSDLYQQKHMLEHDLRTLEEKQDHFEDKDEEALKGDFVDNVDQHTGRSSIVQMQANNVFPSITADFYSMNSLDDLTDGHLSELPEQEKAILRKKWKLYQKWKEKFGGAVDSKVEDLQRRLKSVKTSIEQTENWIKPYVQTIKQMEGDPEERLHEMTDPYMLEGYASSMRGMKVVAHAPVRTDEDDEGNSVVTHRDVVVMDVMHLSLGGTEQPQAPGQGAEVVIMDFKEYTVCEHVFNEVFKPQIEQREHEVKRYVNSFVGDEIPEEIEEHTDKQFVPYDMSFPKQLQRNVMRWFGMGDEYFHPSPSDLRTGLLGPAFGGASPLYIEIKYDIGLYVMK
jgi:predicted  nucleic acid-binding Zn-ribbon protein